MRNNIKIISTPDEGGVKDYSIALCKNLKKKGLNCENIYLTKKNRLKIRKKIKKKDVIIFNYEAYGYQVKGIPFWLINELSIIKSLSLKLGIYFHEIYAKYNIFDIRCIIMLSQIFIVKKLLDISDFWATNNNVYFKWLKANSKKKNYFILNTVSNFQDKYNLKKNKKKVIIFGSEASRINVYKNNTSILLDWKKKNCLDYYDIGPISKNMSYIKYLKKKINLKITGKISENKISKIFSSANLGILNCDPKLILKSSIFAAYSKFKICPINVNEKIFLKKRFISNKFLNYLPNISKNKSIDIIKIKNFNFSKNNNIDNHAKIFLEYLYQ